MSRNVLHSHYCRLMVSSAEYHQYTTVYLLCPVGIANRPQVHFNIHVLLCITDITVIDMNVGRLRYSLHWTLQWLMAHCVCALCYMAGCAIEAVDM